MDKINFIALDVDGTLTNSKKEITEKTKAALMKCQEHGVRLILASGRPTTGLQGLAHELEMDKHHGLLVAYNGSKVIDCQSNEVLFNEPMSVEQGRAVLEHMKKFDVYPMVDREEYMYVNNVFAKHLTVQEKEINIIEYEARGGHYLLCEQADLAEFADFEINKILTAGQPEYLQENYKAMMEPFEDTLSCMFTADMYFEFTAKGVDKAKAIGTVLKSLGVSPESLMAFGDGQNDLSMVCYAGIGVAMGNAVQELKDVADFVTDSNEEDGIAAALNKILPEVF